MAVLGGCHGDKKTPILREIKCQKCGEEMEVFTKDGKSIEDAKCDQCGWEIKEGDSVS